MSIQTLFLIIALVLALIGFLLGLGLGSLFSGQRSPKNLPAKMGRVEVARLWRDEQTGKLIPEMNGQELQQPGSMSAAQQASLFQAVLDLRPWINVQDKAPAPLQTGPPITPVSRPAAAQPNQQPIQRPSMNPVDVLARAISADVHGPDTVSQSIVAQIDAILQQKLADPALMPSQLNSRAIRLMELPGKGMVVMVGLDRYDSVEAVPDPEIRGLIHACVAEWEAR